MQYDTDYDLWSLGANLSNAVWCANPQAHPCYKRLFRRSKTDYWDALCIWRRVTYVFQFSVTSWTLLKTAIRKTLKQSLKFIAETIRANDRVSVTWRTTFSFFANWPLDVLKVTRGSTLDTRLPPFFFSLIVSFLNRDTTANLENRFTSVCAKRMSCQRRNFAR